MLNDSAPPFGRVSLVAIAAAAALFVIASCSDSGATRATNPGGADANPASASVNTPTAPPVSLEVFAPGDGDKAGLNGLGWFIDIDLEFPGDLHSTGFTGNQLTGPDVHNNVAPFPGVFAPGKDDRFGGLVVLLSTTTIGAGSCQNTANLFNLTGPTNTTADETEIWDTWIITAANFGVHTPSTLTIAEIRDLNRDGVYNDAPDVVPDADGNGICDARDVKQLGVASNVEVVNFFIR